MTTLDRVRAAAACEISKATPLTSAHAENLLRVADEAKINLGSVVEIIEKCCAVGLQPDGVFVYLRECAIRNRTPVKVGGVRSAWYRLRRRLDMPSTSPRESAWRLYL